MMTNYDLTEEEWECVRVCVANAPIPYDISKKKIPAEILDKIGQPKTKKHKTKFLNELVRRGVNVVWVVDEDKENLVEG